MSDKNPEFATKQSKKLPQKQGKSRIFLAFFMKLCYTI